MTPYRVLLTHGAARDLRRLRDFIADADSPRRADSVLDKIASVLDRLSQLPERGAIPRELDALGIREFREVFFKPYRVIYFVEGDAVYVVLIADGRRDMQALL